MDEGIPLAAQMLAEFLNVARRKRLMSLEDARQLVTGLAGACEIAHSTTDDLLAASILSERHQLQYFDALIVAVAARASATTFYSEDMQHGLAIAGLTIINPFQAA